MPAQLTLAVGEVAVDDVQEVVCRQCRGKHKLDSMLALQHHWCLLRTAAMLPSSSQPQQQQPKP